MQISIAMTFLAPAFLMMTEVSAAGCVGVHQVSSGPSAISIAELYTSEGCNSCPPADKWFSKLRLQKDGIVPLAFHVDYWDYIGWKDRFAKAEFSERQRESVRRHGGQTSYTPQVLINGQDQRRWSDQSQWSSILQKIVARPPRANLALKFSVAPTSLDAALAVTMPQFSDRADVAVFLAITENNLSSRVTAGENRGTTLKHDHVVRAIIGPLSGDAKDRAEGKVVIKQPITLERGWKHDDLSLVAFVQNLRTGEVYQALSTPICGNA